MEITFKRRTNSQTITLEEFEYYQDNIVNKVLPADYREFMLSARTNNGGIVYENNIYNISFPEGGGVLSDLFPIKYGGTGTIELVNERIGHALPEGYLAIGANTGGGYILMSLNADNYGTIKEWYADGSIEELAPSFRQFLEDQRIDEED
ncbi:SMI1/KNR4 family protein [Tenacibaculum tangerinum]|uniref:SMI1/KNR4 family protein n=1 Tax=Tenacibaculum tangerinum TaxID=3038772 RepID=A0ABY8L420_9FLAO|nr:SMI1/KNR4 family protein [Tenacibaculum tangerinum]WGH75108.1 SMI1/KNR4 family protein [Tenacibaculum tangerinum]